LKKNKQENPLKELGEGAAKKEEGNEFDRRGGGGGE